MALSRGEDIKLRRERLGWRVNDAATFADIGHDTVINIEKDRNVTTRSVEAYVKALDKAEQERGPNLSRGSSTPVPTKEGADVPASAARRKSLRRIEAALSKALDEIRSQIAGIDAFDSERPRKRG